MPLFLKKKRGWLQGKEGTGQAEVEGPGVVCLFADLILASGTCLGYRKKALALFYKLIVKILKID